MAAPVSSPPNPNDIRRQYIVDSNGQKGTGDTAGISPAQAVLATTTYGCYAPIAGAAKGRIRAKCSVGATLRVKFVLADGATDSATADNPADVTLAAGVENSMNLTFSGEGLLHIQVIVGGSPGTLNFVDVSQL